MSSTNRTYSPFTLYFGGLNYPLKWLLSIKISGAFYSFQCYFYKFASNTQELTIQTNKIKKNTNEFLITGLCVYIVYSILYS